MTITRFREFKLPDVGEGLTSAEITAWLVGPGDTVRDGMPVCEVETAKATVELPIPYDGVVHEVRFAAGETVAVGAVIITVDTARSGGAETAQPTGPAQTAGAAETADGRQAVLVGYGIADESGRRRPRRPVPGTGTAAAAPAPAAPAPGAVAPDEQRARAKPPVRRLARDLGVDLAAVIPSGADGVITRQDVHAAHTAHISPVPPVPPVPPVALRPAAESGERRLPVKGVRRAVAEAMVASAFTAPHVTVFQTVDVTRTVKLVHELREDQEFAGLRVTPLLLVSRALLVAIRKYPEINASWDEENQEIVVREAVNLGIAAATPRGLLVPNIKSAHTRTLPQLAESLQTLVETARGGGATPADLTGGTITITNIGVFGVDAGTPILNPGEAAILAVGAIRTQPWVHRGEVRPREVATLALSFDHRVVDGELGSKVLATVGAVLERPKRLLAWA